MALHGSHHGGGDRMDHARSKSRRTRFAGRSAPWARRFSKSGCSIRSRTVLLPEMLPRTWDSETLMKSIPWMRLQNLGGRNIYVRPHGEHNLSMLDDLTAQAVARLRSSGFRPALVVETSPGNFQAWLKHAEALSPALSTAVAKKLAKLFDADPGAADWRHFGRLSGFTNRKQAHQAANGLYPLCGSSRLVGRNIPKHNDSWRTSGRSSLVGRNSGMLRCPGVRPARGLRGHR